MPLKKTVNDSLTRVTGYQVTRAQTGASLSERQVRSLSTSSRALATTAKTLAATVRQLEAELKAARAEAPESTPAPAQAQRTTPSKPSAETFPRDYDEDVREIIRAVRPFSMTGTDQLHALITAARYVSRGGVPGDIVEFGVWRGGTMKAVALALEAADDVSRELYLYDTFEAMTAPTAPTEGPGADAGANTVASLADVQDRFTSGRYPQDKIHFRPGTVAESIPDQLPERIAILRLDIESFEFTDDELASGYDRLVPGGVLMIDGYGWDGSRDPIARFLERTGAKLLLLRVGSGRVAVKP